MSGALVFCGDDDDDDDELLRDKNLIKRVRQQSEYGITVSY